MLITRLKLKNWRNFKKVDVALRDRVYVIGPNASGKSNLLDVIRFLRDVAKAEGGGLQKAVKDRGGITKLRSLLARKDPEVSIEVEISERIDTPPLWRYVLSFRSEGKGRQRLVVSKEQVVDLKTAKDLILRPNLEDKKDTDRLTQTYLEQINTNKDFRAVSEFFSNVTYLHLVPQLLKHADQLGGYRLEDDPFGQAFLERIAKTQERTQAARLSKIGEVLKVCVPNMRNLRFKRDEVTGTPHLEALYEHWRPDAGWQREDQFSDGTLRLLGIMWSLLEGDSLLLLEEPELSLNEDIVRQIHRLIWNMQRQAKYRRQVFITTHSEALLQDQSINAREVIRLEPTKDGTLALEALQEEVELISSGYTVAEVLLPKTKPTQVNQLSLFKP
ncbi:MAG: chromosome segregation protein SMC [Betaproteobacteria bacterium HGW-Betaproteobacteria-18]|nr:MAG: chromosome segregation protein SMC [Deltaproteobacteria bacterium HGW-Deltaproteobacteria-3]PKO58865.1 MAG: chromosome segregation protein SMC [Betaproteobacteria bacterium HGW-Betaproteobacteria-18]